MCHAWSQLLDANIITSIEVVESLLTGLARMLRREQQLVILVVVAVGTGLLFYAIVALVVLSLALEEVYRSMRTEHRVVAVHTDTAFFPYTLIEVSKHIVGRGL